jgi:hypothetical protein
MRLTALLLMVLAVTDAKNVAMPDLSGIWIADIARCNFGTSPRPNWLTLNVTRNGDRLSVIEVARDNGEIHLAERQYVLKSGVRPIGAEVGSAKIAGRMTVLQFSGQLDRWRSLKMVPN